MTKRGDLLFFKIIIFDFQNEQTNLKRLTTFSMLQKVNDILAWTRLFRRLLDFREILDLEKFYIQTNFRQKYNLNDQ